MVVTGGFTDVVGGVVDEGGVELLGGVELVGGAVVVSPSPQPTKKMLAKRTTTTNAKIKRFNSIHPFFNSIVSATGNLQIR